MSFQTRPCSPCCGARPGQETEWGLPRLAPPLWLPAAEGWWGPWAGLQAEVSVSRELIWAGNSGAGRYSDCLVEELGEPSQGLGGCCPCTRMCGGLGVRV